MATEGGGDPETIDKDRLAIVVDVWKYIVSVQMHFNDMEMKIRNLYFTILAAAMGLIGVVQGKRIEFYNPHFSISLALFVIFALIPVSMLFYFMDRHWYHRLLVGSVNQCIVIETKYKELLPEIQLGSQISAASPVEFGNPIWKLMFFFVRDPRFKKGSKLHSDAKIEILYKSVIWASALLIAAYLPVGGIRISGCALLPFASDKICWQTAAAGSAQPATPLNPAASDKTKSAPSSPSDASPQK